MSMSVGFDQARVGRRVRHHEDVDHQEEGQGDGRHQEDPVQRQGGHDHRADVEGEVDAEGDEDAEDGAEHPALAHMEPGGVALDDGHGAEALEVHVGGVEQSEDPEEVGADELRALAAAQQHPGAQAHERVGHEGPARPRDDGLLAAVAVGEGAVDDEGHAVDHGADGEDLAEDGVAHQGAAGRVLHVLEHGLGDGQVVAAHVEEHVGQAEGQPVHQAAAAVGVGVHDALDPRQAGDDEGHHDQQHEDGGEFLQEARFLGRRGRGQGGRREGTEEEEHACESGHGSRPSAAWALRLVP